MADYTSSPPRSLSLLPSNSFDLQLLRSDNTANADKNIVIISKKSNLHYTRGITPKRVTSGGAHLRGLAPGLHNSEETSQLWRHCVDLTGPGIEPQTSRTDSVRLATELTGRLYCHHGKAQHNKFNSNQSWAVPRYFFNTVIVTVDIF